MAKAKDYKPGGGGKRTNIDFDEDDLKHMAIVKKHIKKLGMSQTDKAAVKRSLYFYSNYIENGITVE